MLGLFQCQKSLLSKIKAVTVPPQLQRLLLMALAGAGTQLAKQKSGCWPLHTAEILRPGMKKFEGLTLF